MKTRKCAPLGAPPMQALAWDQEMTVNQQPGFSFADGLPSISSIASREAGIPKINLFDLAGMAP